MNKDEIRQIINDIELDILTMIFVTLKLCGVIHWNWSYIITPLIFEFALHMLIIFINRRR